MTSYKYYFHVTSRGIELQLQKSKELDSLYIRIVMTLSSGLTNTRIYCTSNFFYDLIALVGLGLLKVEVSRSYSDTPHSVGLLWTSDRPVAGTATWQHTTLRQTSMPPAGLEPAIPVSERPRTHALDRTATGIAHSDGYDKLQRAVLYLLYTARTNTLRTLKDMSGLIMRILYGSVGKVAELLPGRPRTVTRFSAGSKDLSLLPSAHTGSEAQWDS